MINKNLILNVYEDKFLKSKLSTQLLYGDNFKIIKKFKNSFKIKSLFDGYLGYIAKQKLHVSVKPTHKVASVCANLYSKPNKNFKLKKKIGFASFINVEKNENKFCGFDKYWIKKSDLDPINKKSQIFSNVKLFENIKYKWGGNSYKGIDCSALIQVFFKYNHLYCPRDSKDQLRYFKNVKKTAKFVKNQLIFWKGHVAICLNKRLLIHAYGPKKKVIIMDIKKTIDQIKNKSKLSVIARKKINVIR